MSVCSIITTASAPRGMTPPVAMVVAVPGLISIIGASPQAITSALSASTFGLPSLAPSVSAARTAKPSTLERSKGGASTAATTSAASTRVERRRERHRFRRKRLEIEMLFEAGARILGRQHFKELLLARGRAHAREQFLLRPRPALPAHIAALMATASLARRCRRQSLRFPPAPKASRRCA